MDLVGTVRKTMGLVWSGLQLPDPRNPTADQAALHNEDFGVRVYIMRNLDSVRPHRSVADFDPPKCLKARIPAASEVLDLRETLPRIPLPQHHRLL